MARPKGYQLDRSALMALLEEKRISMTEAAALCDDMPLTTLSSLATGDSRASIKTVRTLAEGLDCDAAILFPDLGRAEVAS